MIDCRSSSWTAAPASDDAATASRRLPSLIRRRAYVRCDQMQDALDLERRQLRVLCADQGADRGHVCGGEAVAGDGHVTTAHPREPQLDAAREELDRGIRVGEE